MTLFLIWREILFELRLIYLSEGCTRVLESSEEEEPPRSLGEYEYALDTTTKVLSIE